MESHLLNDAIPDEEEANLLREDMIQRILEEDPEFGDYSLAGKILRVMPKCSPSGTITDTERQKFTKFLRQHLKPVERPRES